MKTLKAQKGFAQGVASIVFAVVVVAVVLGGAYYVASGGLETDPGGKLMETLGTDTGGDGVSDGGNGDSGDNGGDSSDNSGDGGGGDA